MLARLLTHTCTIARNGVTVATGVNCFFQEGVRLTKTGDLLDGMLNETTPKVNYSVIFGVDVDVREHDIIGTVAYPGESSDTRRYAVQTVVTARRPQGTAQFTTAWMKLA